jgi:Ca2+-binding EF-hand superfamily protein
MRQGVQGNLQCIFLNQFKFILCDFNMYVPVQSLTAKLQLLDPKETGFLTLESFSDVVASSGEQFSDEEIKLMFQDADIDGDGKARRVVLTSACFASQRTPAFQLMPF